MRQRERQRERQRHRDTETDRDRQRQRQRHRETETNRLTDRMRLRNRDRHRETEAGEERHRETERERERQTDRDRERWGRSWLGGGGGGLEFDHSFNPFLFSFLRVPKPCSDRQSNLEAKVCMRSFSILPFLLHFRFLLPAFTVGVSVSWAVLEAVFRCLSA